jgi:hypothetical protein
MKTTKKIKGSWLMAGLLMLSTTVLAISGNEDEFADTINFNSYYGQVIDLANGRNLPFATIEAIGSNIATVSNIDGDYVIAAKPTTSASKIPSKLSSFFLYEITEKNIKKDNNNTSSISVNIRSLCFCKTCFCNNYFLD